MITLLTVFAALTATPTTLDSVLKKARSGDRITLSRGNYGDVSVQKADYKPPLQINASAAQMTGLSIRRASGVQVRGGWVKSSSPEFAVRVDEGKDVLLEGLLVSGGARIGMTVVRSEGVQLVRNRLQGLRSDGINITASKNVLVRGNSCSGFNPIAAVYSALGKLLRDGDHPDCIQAWSAKGYAPTSDLQILGNTADGLMQGVFLNDSGSGEGYDRITIKWNVMKLAAFNGIVLMGARNSEVSGNVVRTVPGSVLPSWPHPKIKTWIYITSAKNVNACGNLVEAWPKGEGTKRC